MPFRNLFLSNLALEDGEALSPHLKPLEVKTGALLLEPGKSVERIYFPVDAAGSLLVRLDSGLEVEVASMGRDGALGVLPALRETPSMEYAVVQSAGVVVTCSADVLRSQAQRSKTLLFSLLQHEQRHAAHLQQMAACATAHTLEARLCRWLLRTRDLAESDELQFTQQHIAELLGMQRTFVSRILSHLKRQNCIDIGRGKLVIQNAKGLRRLSCECYSAIQSIHGAAG